jgi:hypothetical protein
MNSDRFNAGDMNDHINLLGSRTIFFFQLGTHHGQGIQMMMMIISEKR